MSYCLKCKTVLKQLHSSSKIGQLKWKLPIPLSYSLVTGIKVNFWHFSAFPQPPSVPLPNIRAPHHPIPDQHKTPRFDAGKKPLSAQEMETFGSAIPPPPHPTESWKKKRKAKSTNSSWKGEFMPLPWAAHFKSEVKKKNKQGFEGGRGVPGVSSCKGQYSACLRLLACARLSSVIP